MTTPLTLDSLEVLDAIDRKGSFAAAATSLNRVPSAISYSVQKLEQDLGITLFQKQGRKSVLTTAGKHLLENGRELINAANQLTASTQQVATGWEPKLRIATDHIIEDDFIYPYIDKLYQLHPQINIELSQEVLAGTWEALIEDKVDLIIGATASPPGHKGIRSIEWQTLEMILVAAPKHPICQQATPLSDDDIRQYRSVIVRDSSNKLAPLNRGIFNRESSIYVPSMTMKINAHCCGLGIGSVPRHRVKEQLKTKQLVELTLKEPLPKTSIYIAWKTTNHGQALASLVNNIQQHVIA